MGDGVVGPTVIETDSPLYKGYKSIMVSAKLKKRTYTPRGGLHLELPTPRVRASPTSTSTPTTSTASSIPNYEMVNKVYEGYVSLKLNAGVTIEAGKKAFS